ATVKPVDELDRDTWRMPPLALLEPVQWNAGTRLGMIALRSYLVVGAILLVVKAIQISHGG
ncbi:MAG: manganese transporter, partial [Actinobacteria bacterium]|nr:manganese transporter [Actinomycetota bacterium]